jgi:hypothetical protein
LVEASLVRLSEADKFVDPAGLIERLEALGGGGGQPRSGQKKKSAPPLGSRRNASYVSDRATKPIADRPSQGSPLEEAPPTQHRPTEGPLGQPVSRNQNVRELTQQEKAAIQKDPAVEEVLGVFGGKVVEYPRVEPETPTQPDDPQIEPDSTDEA